MEMVKSQILIAFLIKEQRKSQTYVSMVLNGLWARGLFPYTLNLIKQKHEVHFNQ